MSMTFGEALGALADGKKVRRKSWGNEGCYWFIRTMRSVFQESGHGKPVVVNDFYEHDANDWEVYDEG